MPDERLVEWIKKQRRSGFSDKQLKEYLISYGYDINTVNEAILASSEENETNTRKKGLRTAIFGFILSLIAGVVVIADVLLSEFFFKFKIVEIEIFSDIGTMFGEFLWIFGLAVGVLMIMSAIVVRRPGGEKIGGISVIILSILSLISGGGFFFGALVGMISGILSIISK